MTKTLVWKERKSSDGSGGWCEAYIKEIEWTLVVDQNDPLKKKPWHAFLWAGKTGDELRISTKGYPTKEAAKKFCEAYVRKAARQLAKYLPAPKK